MQALQRAAPAARGPLVPQVECEHWRTQRWSLRKVLSGYMHMDMDMHMLHMSM